MPKYINIIRYLRTNKTIHNGALFSIFSFFNKGISFILLIVLANYILPAEYGLLSLFYTVVMLMGYFIDLNTHGYLSISFFKGEKEEFKKDFSAICLITITMCAIIGTFLTLFNKSLSDILNLSTHYLYISLLSSFCAIFTAMNLDYLRIREKVSLYGILSCSYAVLNMLLSLFLVIKVKLNWEGRVYAQIVCDLIYLIIAIIWFYKDKLYSFSFEWKRYKRILLWGIPLIPHAISNWIRQGCDRYIIDSTHSTYDVGLFSFALNLTSIIIMIGTSFNASNSVNIFQVLASDKDEESKRKDLLKKEKLITLCYILSSIIIVSAISIFIPVLLPNYSASIPYFLILSIYGIMQCIYFLYCNYLFYYNKTRELMYITLGSSILHFLLSIILTRYSLYLTCIIYVISFSIVTFLVKLRARRVYPLKN